MFWRIPAQPGSLCNLWKVIRCTQVDKSVKIFNVGDEFLVHAFKAHLTASILTSHSLSNTLDPTTHTTTRGWLQQAAGTLVTLLLIPEKFEDPVYNLHRAFLHYAFLFVDLQEAICWENVPQIIRHWKYWLPRFLATGRKKLCY